MGSDPDREPPFFFTKWAETLVQDGETVRYPSATSNFQFEAELVVAIGGSGRDVGTDEAPGLIWGYAAGLDMTRRDLQIAARKIGRPWDTGKNVEQSSPLGPLCPISAVGHLARGKIELSVNGVRRQSADLADLIWPVPDIIAFLSRLWRLMPGDLIFTGTPAGVGPVVPGDRLECLIEGLPPLCVEIGESETG
jgi:fumarylpyruvate hydrolase